MLTIIIIIMVMENKTYFIFFIHCLLFIQFHYFIHCICHCQSHPTTLTVTNTLVTQSVSNQSLEEMD